MADSDNSTGVVAVLVIFVVIVVGGLFAYRSGMLGEGGSVTKDIDVEINTPAKDNSPAPARGPD